MKTIGLLGGTGDLGKGLSVHFVHSYEKVIVGSRSKEKAEAIVSEIISDNMGAAEILNRRLQAADNAEVASSADVIVVTVPYEVAIQTVKQLQGSFRGNQLVISAVAAIEKKENEFRSAKGISVTKEIRLILPESVEVAAAFQTVPARVLYRNSIVEGDIFVACNKKTTYESCSEVIRSIRNLRPLYVGSLEVAPEIEGLTSILLNLAIKNRLRNPTFKILEPEPK